MDFVFNEKEMLDIARAFYIATGIRLTIWNSSLLKSVCYPTDNCDFCTLMKNKPYTEQQCWKCDLAAMNKISDQDNCVIYNCHAGLVDCVIKIREADDTLGYLMLGQISDAPNPAEYSKHLLNICRSYHIPDEQSIPAIHKIRYFSREQIEAAVKIAETCASYIMVKKLILPRKNLVVERARAYIHQHLHQDFSISDLCQELGVSRTRLYNIFQEETKMGIAKYILSVRMSQARSLLINTDMPIYEIANQVGFSDYNYFSRVYKKTFGQSPKTYRKS